MHDMQQSTVYDWMRWSAYFFLLLHWNALLTFDTTALIPAATGKSNVWAIEPKMKVDDGENKGAAFATGAAVLAVCAALVVATLTNLPAPETY